MLFHFANQNNIETISSTLKNKISFKSPEDILLYNKFVVKYSNSYTANKSHAKENFLYYLKISNQLPILENIKKTNYTDIADSFMQIIAYCVFTL